MGLFYLKMEAIYVGKIVALHGIKGDIIIAHNLGENHRQTTLKSLLVEDRNGSLLPWFIDAITLRKQQNEWLVKLEGIESREQATRLLKKRVHLLQADFEICVNKKTAQSLIGFMLLHNEERIGVISHVHEQLHQVIAVTEYKNNEVLIPLHNESILRIDRKKKELHVQLPDGLLDIYIH